MSNNYIFIAFKAKLISSGFIIFNIESAAISCSREQPIKLCFKNTGNPR